MQDTSKTLKIYEESLYPTMQRLGLDQLVENNASPHNNETVRERHRRHNILIVGYDEVTTIEKDQIRALIRHQVTGYVCARVCVVYKCMCGVYFGLLSSILQPLG